MCDHNCAKNLTIFAPVFPLCRTLCTFSATHEFMHGPEVQLQMQENLIEKSEIQPHSFKNP